MSSRKGRKFNDWKIDLDLLCRERLGLGLDDFTRDQVTPAELRDYWSDGSSPREFLDEVITSTDNREIPDTDFDVKFEI